MEPAAHPAAKRQRTCDAATEPGASSSAASAPVSLEALPPALLVTLTDLAGLKAASMMACTCRALRDTAQMVLADPARLEPVLRRDMGPAWPLWMARTWPRLCAAGAPPETLESLLIEHAAGLPADADVATLLGLLAARGRPHQQQGLLERLLKEPRAATLLLQRARAAIPAQFQLPPQLLMAQSPEAAALAVLEQLAAAVAVAVAEPEVDAASRHTLVGCAAGAARAVATSDEANVKFGMTSLLTVTCERGQNDTLRALLAAWNEAGADPDRRWELPAMYNLLSGVCARGQLDMLQALLGSDAVVAAIGEGVAVTILGDVCERGQLDVLEALLDNGAYLAALGDMGAMVATILVCDRQNKQATAPDVLRVLSGNQGFVELLGPEHSHTVLLAACGDDGAAAVRTLMASDAFVAQLQIQPRARFEIVCKACDSGNVDTLTALLDSAGFMSALRARDAHRVLEDYIGCRPMRRALLGSPGFVSRLGPRGVHDALADACERGQVGLLREELLASRALMATLDPSRATLLLLGACERGQVEVVRALLACGAFAGLLRGQWQSYFVIQTARDMISTGRMAAGAADAKALLWALKDGLQG